MHTAEGRLSLFGATERASKFAFAELHAQDTRRIAANFRRALIASELYKIHTVLTDHGTQFTALTHCRKAADQQEAVRHPEGLSLLHAFDDACEQAGSEHRLTKPGHPWTNGQVERMNRTLKEATVKRDYYATHQQLKEPLYNFLNVYNCAKRLKPLQKASRLMNTLSTTGSESRNALPSTHAITPWDETGRPSQIVMGLDRSARQRRVAPEIAGALCLEPRARDAA